ncbi:MAG TPA: hypothetical protein VHX42_03545 [Candidatus Babeliales bacterium]|nr:hypothetical protein [Candidatus Babeliales bacterium]
MKKLNFFLSLILLSTPLSYGMKRLREGRSIPTGSRLLLPTGRWVEVVGDVLLDEANIRDLVHFTDLPPEMLSHIIYFLNEIASAQSLEAVAKNISNLAMVSKQLNLLVNNPSFCLAMIKHLSQKFNCTNQKVAEVLQIKEAQRRLELQKELYNACSNDETDIQAYKQQIELCLSQGADINFTYYNKTDGSEESLLGDAVYNVFGGEIPNILPWFIEKGVDIHQQNTLLIFEVRYLNYGVSEHDVDIIRILLNAKADPEITTENGPMLLQMENYLRIWQEQYDQEDRALNKTKEEEEYLRELLSHIHYAKIIIQMFEDAIKRKHQK